MPGARDALIQRIRAMRRRHFGARGKAEFARRLEIPLEQYERFERGQVPPGETLLRMCEATGEDLQWLLTGVASRGTVVISGARPRHQELISRIAAQLDVRPDLAAPLEALLDLLTAEPRGGERHLLAPVEERELVPLLNTRQVPESAAALEAGEFLDPQRALPAGPMVTSRGLLVEPAARGEARRVGVDIVAIGGAAGEQREFVRGSQLGRCFPGLFGVRIPDDAMRPMFEPGDAALVAPGMPAAIGRPALCRSVDEPTVRCRIWLGRDEKGVHLGRLGDSRHEVIPADAYRWSLEVMYRITQVN